MLRINQQRSSAGAKSYFNEGLAREDYYTRDEILGRWGGKGAARLGLSGDVTRDAFHSLCDNINPVTGQKLTCRTRENRSVAYDFTFNAPKSLSVLQALTKDERLLDAFRDSVRDTMQEMEAEVRTRVRRGGANEERVTGNLLYGEFVHLTSRPVGGVPDPHMHSHVVVFNATYDQVEDKWKAAQFRDLVRDAPYYEAAFHARLSRAVAELGYGVERTKKGWEVAGFSRETLEKFARRTAQIERTAIEKGITSPEEKSQLGAKTREKKGESRPYEEVQAEWRSRLGPLERLRLVQIAAKRVPPKEPPATARDTVQHAMRHGFERQSVVSEKRLMATALKRGYGSVKVDDVKRSFALEKEFIRRRMGEQSLLTTKQVLAEEAAVIAYARDGRGVCKPLAKGNVEFDGGRLNHQQKDAVRHVLTSSDRVMLIRGAAGTGKTSLLRAATKEIEARGQEVHVFAPTTEAARGVLRKDGFDQADTVARLLADPQMQEKTHGGVIWVDEAGLVGMRDLRQVFRVAKEQQARVVLMGDSRQHASVPRGDALRLLETHAGIKPAEVSEILRQKGEYKQAVECLAKGDVCQGFERLDRMGSIQQVAEDKRHRRLADDYLAAVREGKSALVVAPTHAEGREVTAIVRAKLQEEGTLDRKERVFAQQSSFSMTEAMRADPVNYQAGDIVQFTQNATGFGKGERWQVKGYDEQGRVLISKAGRKSAVLPLVEAQRFDVYEKRDLRLAVGDRIRITQNGTTVEGHRINNGSLHTVTGFDRAGNILLDDNKTVAKDYGNLTHGYCTTSYAAQGKTVDKVLIAMGENSMPATSQEQFYVSVSRGRQSATVYCSDKQELLEAGKNSRERMSATELTEAKPQPPTKGRLRIWRNGDTQRRRDRAELGTAVGREKRAKDLPEHERNRNRGIDR